MKFPGDFEGGGKMHASYYFVIATALAVLPIAFIFKISLERLIEDPSSIEKTQTKFFLWIAIVESLPILFVIFGFINAEPVQTMNELMMPGIIVFMLAAFGVIFILLQRLSRIPEEIKGTVNTFVAIGSALINSIPIISIVALLTMMPA